MRQSLAAAATLVASPGSALAHPGHLQETAGHTHWVAVGALSFAGLVTLAGIARSVRRHRIDPNGRTAGQK